MVIITTNYLCSAQCMVGTEVGLSMSYALIAEDYATCSSTLIQVLTTFVTQLVQAQSLDVLRTPPVESSSSNESGPALTEEAKQLITAFKAFILSLHVTAAPSTSQESSRFADEAQLVVKSASSRMLVSRNDQDNATGTATETLLPLTKSIEDRIEILLNRSMAEKKQVILNKALQKAHYIVFNRMPIRMLMFSAGGTNIKLVERPEIFRHVSSQINDFLDYLEEHRLLVSTEVGKFETSCIVDKCTQYAILSHTWFQCTPGEVTFADWNTRRYDPRSAPYAKLANFCRIASTEYDLTFAWMDTVCINKDSSSELDESIRSMYKWYQAATMCITYLSNTSVLGDISTDAWFTRGWTLQELIAPPRIKFYSRDWTGLNRKPHIKNDKYDTDITDQIYKATYITVEELRKNPLRRRPSISRRMQWAANRRVTREEDMAYSLMGIFNVSISVAYGEGAQRAFFRLVREIMSLANRDEETLDIANWGTGPNPSKYVPYGPSCLIPSGPQVYAYRETFGISDYNSMQLRPMTLTRFGCQVQVLLLPAVMDLSTELTAMKEFVPKGNFFGSTQIAGQSASRYNILDSRAFIANTLSWWNTTSEVTLNQAISSAPWTVFAVLNFLEECEYVCVPDASSCLAIQLDFLRTADINSSNTFARRYTEKPIRFKLQSIGAQSFTVQKSQLYKHGIVFRTLYL